MIAPLPLHVYVHWATNSCQAACPAAGDGWGEQEGGTGTYCPWLSHHIDLPPSYLAPAKTHSSVLTQAYYTSFLPCHTTKSEQSGCWQVESPKQVFSSKVIHWSQENTDYFSLSSCELFGISTGTCSGCVEHLNPTANYQLLLIWDFAIADYQIIWNVAL